MGGFLLQAKSEPLDLTAKRADKISKKRVAISKWKGQSISTLNQKVIPIKKWSKHYNSLGRKRASVTDRPLMDRKVYATRTREYPVKSMDLSHWNDRIAKLQKQARITTDDSVNHIEEKRIYGMMLEAASQYKKMRKKLSLRDLNRFQFRRNHQASGVPMQKAGAGDSQK